MTDMSQNGGRLHLAEMRDEPPRDPRWPYRVERPGRGQVRACPTCGRVAVFTCFHGYSVKTVVMNAAKAAHLRRTSGEYEAMEFTCAGCGYEGPFEAGMQIGHDGFFCARCAGRSERQVAIARRQVVA
jgi:predicted RNA-binding Zn-ribbon protein involved in translation (DUF1610 family)